VQTKGIAYWEVRNTINGKRRFMTLEGGQYPLMPLVDAKAGAARIKQLAIAGTYPLAERLKHPNILKRIYTKEIKPSIGGLALADVNARDIRPVIHKVAQSNRHAIA
jgi:hypothetical protein